MNLTNLAKKAKNLARAHRGTVDTAIDKVATTVDQRTKGKYASQVDGAQKKIKRSF